jgi:uncharacterized membrane protein YhaH (DUF805 family)
MKLLAIIGLVKYVAVLFLVIKIASSRMHDWLVKFSCVLLLLALTLVGISNTLGFDVSYAHLSLMDAGRIVESLAIILVLLCLSRLNSKSQNQ